MWVAGEWTGTIFPNSSALLSALSSLFPRWWLRLGGCWLLRLGTVISGPRKTAHHLGFGNVFRGISLEPMAVEGCEPVREEVGAETIGLGRRSGAGRVASEHQQGEVDFVGSKSYRLTCPAPGIALQEEIGLRWGHPKLPRKAGSLNTQTHGLELPPKTNHTVSRLAWKWPLPTRPCWNLGRAKEAICRVLCRPRSSSLTQNVLGHRKATKPSP